MKPEEIVQFDKKKMLDAIGRRKGTEVIEVSNPWDAHEKIGLENSILAYEINMLLTHICKKKGILPKEFDIDLDMFRLHPTRKNIVYIEGDSEEIKQANKKITSVVYKLTNQEPETFKGTPLEQEFVHLSKLLEAIKRFRANYQLSFDKKHGLETKKTIEELENSFHQKEASPYSRKSHGVITEGSPLHNSILNLHNRIVQTAKFQFSPEAIPYYREKNSSNMNPRATDEIRLDKFCNFTELFAPRKLNQIEELQHRFRNSYANRRQPKSLFVSRIK